MRRLSLWEQADYEAPEPLGCSGPCVLSLRAVNVNYPPHFRNIKKYVFFIILPFIQF